MRDIMPPVQNSLLYPLLRLKARRLPAVQLESDGEALSFLSLGSCFGGESLFPGNHFWWKKGSRTAPISHVVAPEFILSFG